MKYKFPLRSQFETEEEYLEAVAAFEQYESDLEQFAHDERE